jgi:hypothetical protein
MIDLTILTALLISLVIGLHRLDSALSIYSWLTLAMLFMRIPQSHQLESFSRYILAIFPTFLVLSQLRSRTMRLGLWVVSLSLLIIFLTIFLNWQWIA